MVSSVALIESPHIAGSNGDGIHLADACIQLNGNGPRTTYISPLEPIRRALDGCNTSPELLELARSHKGQRFSPFGEDSLRVRDSHLNKIIVGHAGALARGFLEYREMLSPARRAESIKNVPLEILYVRACEGDADGRWVRDEFGMHFPDYSLFTPYVREKLIDQVLTASMFLDSAQFLRELRSCARSVTCLMRQLEDVDVSSDLREIFRPGFDGGYCRGSAVMERMLQDHLNQAIDKVSATFEARHTRILTHRFISEADWLLDTFYMDPRLLVRRGDHLHELILSKDEPTFTYNTVRNALAGVIAHKLAPRDHETQVGIAEALRAGRTDAWDWIHWNRLTKAVATVSSLRILYLLP